MASIYDLYIEQGADFSQSLNLVGDFTGQTIDGTLNDSVSTEITGFIAWTNEAEGEFDIVLTNAQTATLSNGVGKYNIEITNSGVVDRVLQGRIYVDGDV